MYFIIINTQNNNYFLSCYSFRFNSLIEQRWVLLLRNFQYLVVQIQLQGGIGVDEKGGLFRIATT